MSSTDTLPAAGLLLVNLGTPDSPAPADVRRYLAEFLWDPRVVETPRWLWWPLLHGIILNTRPRRSAEAYRRIWTEAGSPLLLHTKRQAEALQARLGKRVKVVPAMRYGNPSIAAGLLELREAGCDRILVVSPLSPVLGHHHRLHLRRGNRGAAPLAPGSRAALHRPVPLGARLHRRPGRQHPGIPAGERDAGEVDSLLPRHPATLRRGGRSLPRQCERTARLLAEALGLEEDRWQLTYQSRMGREPWLQPYTSATLEALAREGVRHVQVLCPGFAADCLETLEEIAMENRDIFLAHGGERYGYIPCLNDRPDHVEALAAIARSHLGGWIHE
jgi:Protoheme ferro-lyase (ferrochelatase)